MEGGGSSPLGVSSQCLPSVANAPQQIPAILAAQPLGSAYYPSAPPPGPEVATRPAGSLERHPGAAPGERVHVSLPRGGASGGPHAPPDSYFLAPILAGGGGSGGGGGGGGSGRWRRRGREQGGGRRTRARHDARAQGGGRGLKSSWRQGRRQGGPQEGQVKPRHVHGPRAVLRRRPSRGVHAHFRLVRVGLAQVMGQLQRGEQEAPGPDGHGLAFLVVHGLRAAIAWPAAPRFWATRAASSGVDCRRRQQTGAATSGVSVAAPLSGPAVIRPRTGCGFLRITSLRLKGRPGMLVCRRGASTLNGAGAGLDRETLEPKSRG